MFFFVRIYRKKQSNIKSFKFNSQLLLKPFANGIFIKYILYKIYINYFNVNLFELYST